MTSKVVPRDLESAADEELVALAAGGGEARAAAWTTLVRRLTPRMYAVARSFRLDSATCDDIVQVAWLKLTERADQLREPGSVRPWLCMVVRNEARNLVTRTRTIPTDSDWDLRHDDSSPVDSALIDAEQATTLRAAFARLGDECRQLIELTIADPPLSYDEIAVAVGRPRGSLGPTRRRCLDQLKSLLPPGWEP